MKFSEYAYSRPDVPALLDAYRALIEQAKTADADALVEIFARHDALSGEYGRMAVVASIRHTIDTRDAFYDAENTFYDQNTPDVSNLQLALYRVLLASPHCQALADKYGEILPEKMRIAVQSADERVLDLMKAENALCSEYQTLYASAMVEFDGKTLPLPQLGPYKQSLDAAVRRAAFEAEGNWFDEHRAQFDEIYTKMVENRNEQAHILGYDDYSRLSYLRMGRIGYGPDEVARYREQVVRDVVPLVDELEHLRFDRVGLPDSKYADLNLRFADGNAQPTGTSDELLAHCREMYHELSPETAAFIDFMFEGENFDVLSKPGKAPGAYMTEIDGYGPFVFANWNGTFDDVDTITHEMGHAFQGYEALKAGFVGELRNPTMESCEIHSMSMEFLTNPWHHLFFGKDTAKYQLAHTEDSLFFLPYGSLVDEFQHIMYQQPGLTADERNAVWAQLEHKYRPWVDFDNLPFYGRGAGWQRQLHIYLYPFYYIDYCLAQTVALQFFALSLKDQKDAWKRYLALVQQAGSASYAGLVTAAGLNVPFAEGSLKPVANTVAKWIRENQV